MVDTLVLSIVKFGVTWSVCDALSDATSRLRKSSICILTIQIVGQRGMQVARLHRKLPAVMVVCAYKELRCTRVVKTNSSQPPIHM